LATSTIAPAGGRARRRAVEQQIFDAVEDLLGEGQVYSELSVSTIAGQAGVARSTFYVHFADKTELLIRLASETTADIFTAATEWTTRVEHGTNADSVKEDLRATCLRIVSDYRQHAEVLAAVMSATGYDPAVAAYWYERINNFIDVAGERLGEAQAAGLVDPAVDPIGLAAMAAWSIERTVSRTVAQNPSDLDDQLADTLAHGLWAMIFHRD
jgi:AcrR family transcriptional regulator